MGIFYSYCTRCNNQISYFVEYEHNGIECDVCFHFNTDREIKGTMFKYNSNSLAVAGVLRVWGENDMEELELIDALKRAIAGSDCIVMDGHVARNEFLSKGWNLAIDNKWITVSESSDKQDGAMYGRWTEKAKKELV